MYAGVDTVALSEMAFSLGFFGALSTCMLDCKRHLYHHNPVVPAYFYIQSYSVLFTEEQRNTKLRNQRIDLLLQALLLFLLLDQRRMPLALLGNDRFAGVFETDKFFLFHLLIELGRAALGRLERTRVREGGTGQAASSPWEAASAGAR